MRLVNVCRSLSGWKSVGGATWGKTTEVCNHHALSKISHVHHRGMKALCQRCHLARMAMQLKYRENYRKRESSAVGLDGWLNNCTHAFKKYLSQMLNALSYDVVFLFLPLS